MFKKFLLILLGLIVVIFIVAFVLLFTPFGNKILKPQIQNQIDNMLPESDRFLTFFSSLSTHGPYTYDNPYFEEYYNLLASNFEEYSAWLNSNTDFIIPDNESDFELFFHSSRFTSRNSPLSMIPRLWVSLR